MSSLSFSLNIQRLQLLELSQQTQIFAFHMNFERQRANFNFLIQDNLGGRLHDRSKEIPKTMKQLTRLFPNRITIQTPQVRNI